MIEDREVIIYGILVDRIEAKKLIEFKTTPQTKIKQIIGPVFSSFFLFSF
jgi:hypothetical protein